MDDFSVYLITLDNGLRVVKDGDDIVDAAYFHDYNYTQKKVSELKKGLVLKMKGGYEATISEIDTVFLKRDVG